MLLKKGPRMRSATGAVPHRAHLADVDVGFLDRWS